MAKKKPKPIIPNAAKTIWIPDAELSNVVREFRDPDTGLWAGSTTYFNEHYASPIHCEGGGAILLAFSGPENSHAGQEAERHRSHSIIIDQNGTVWRVNGYAQDRRAIKQTEWERIAAAMKDPNSPESRKAQEAADIENGMADLDRMMYGRGANDRGY